MFRKFPGLQVYTDPAHDDVGYKPEAEADHRDDDHRDQSEIEMAFIVKVGPPGLPPGELPAIGHQDQEGPLTPAAAAIPGSSRPASSPKPMILAQSLDIFENLLLDELH